MFYNTYMWGDFCYDHKNWNRWRALHAGVQMVGHLTFVLTLSTYADYINEDEQAAPKVGRGVAQAPNVVDLPTRKASSA